MFQLVKRILKHSTAYAFGTVLNRAVSIVLLPLYTSYLTKVEYGILEILLITSTVILLSLQFGIGSAIFRNVIYKKNANRKLVISTSFYFLMCSSTVAIVILFIFSETISILLFDF